MFEDNLLLFEKSRSGRGTGLLPSCDVPEISPGADKLRRAPLRLPEMAEVDLSRHYTGLARKTFGVNNGFYPLGSCTMKYNPKINEEAAALPGFTQIHPLQPEHSIQGCLELLVMAEKLFAEITGMDAFCFQPAAGAHGEYLGLQLIKAHHRRRGAAGRDKIIVPDAAHGTNPATASMCGLKVISIPSDSRGRVDLEKLKAAAGEDLAGFMFTNPNTLGVFDENILEITEIIHKAGGLNYYDGANLNAVAGLVRPGDMGFDVIHLNLHKTFSTPHGGGGPGSGALGCKALLKDFLPESRPRSTENGCGFFDPPESVGRIKAFYGNFLVVVKALTYVLNLGADGLRRAAGNAVLNANYLKAKLQDAYTIPCDGPCMHEFVISLADLKKAKGITAIDVAKTLLDHGMHPPTMYFPLIVEEALMVEPTETESRETLDRAAEVFLEIRRLAEENPQALHQAPGTTPVSRPDEVLAARQPRLRFTDL